MQHSYDEHTKYLVDDPDYEDPFNARHADQVARATNSVLNEMCYELDVKEYGDLVLKNLNKRSVTKEKLCDWLQTLCYILNRYASPHLQMAAERVDKQNISLIAEQKTVIDLQKELIEKKDEELKSVQTTVQTEMKSYSSALKKTCAAALTPKKICTAVKTIAEKDERSRNIVIYGISESDGEKLENKVSEVLGEINEKPSLRDCCRVGLKRADTSRPTKLSLNSSDTAAQVLRKAKLLRTKEGYKNIYICPDRSVEERRAFKKLWEELKEKRKAEPNRVHFIRNNKIVSSDKNSVSALSEEI